MRKYNIVTMLLILVFCISTLLTGCDGILRLFNLERIKDTTPDSEPQTTEADDLPTDPLRYLLRPYLQRVQTIRQPPQHDHNNDYNDTTA